MISRICVSAVIAAFFAQPVLADWTYRAPQASDDNGSAYVQGQGGTRLNVGCGNGGIVSMGISPDPRPSGMKNMSKPILMFRVDGGPMLQMPATCSNNGCNQDFMLGGEPWPVSQMQAITRALRAGSVAEVLMAGQVIERYPLTGSSSALGTLKQRNRFCDGL